MCGILIVMINFYYRLFSWLIFKLYVYGGWSKPVSIKEYLLVITAAMKTKAIKVLERFPPELNNTDPRDLMSNVATKWVFTCSSRNFLENYMSHPRSNKNIKYMSIFDFPLDFNGKLCLNKMFF